MHNGGRTDEQNLHDCAGRYCLVRFYENVAPFSETQGELTVSGFEYDEYHLELPFYDGIYDDK